MQSGLWNDEY